MSSSSIDAATMMVRLVTQVASIRVPSTSISVPVTLTRSGLSAVVSHLLGVEGGGYEFCVSATQVSELQARRDKAAGGKGEQVGIGVATAPIPRHLLRTSLRAYARALGLSAEEVLILEYAPAQRAPEEGPASQAPDWVCALGAGQSFLAAGLGDGTLLLTSSAAFLEGSAGSSAAAWKPAGLAHSGGVSGLDVYESEAAALVASCGKDGCVRLWQHAGGESGSSSSAKNATGTLRYLAELAGASEACNRVAFDPSGRLLVAGDAAGAVLLWDTAGIQLQPPPPSTSEGGATKRQRTGAAPQQASSRASTVQPVRTFSGPGAHDRQQIAGVAWLSTEAVATAGWSGSICVWDVEHATTGSGGGGGGSGAGAGGAGGGAPLTTIQCGRAPTALASSLLGGVLASGHGDGCVRLWDSRGRGGAGAVGLGEGEADPGAAARQTVGQRGTLHPGVSAAWISDVAWCPTSAHLVAASDFGGTVRLWDMRAPTSPLAVLSSHGAARALAVRWVWPAAVISGGADNAIKSSKVPL
jgi:ribosome biogenesis protein YTM1